MSDSESLESPAPSKKSNDDFLSMCTDLVSTIPIKKTILLFLSCLIMLSDIFVENVLSKFSDTTDGISPNNKGTTIQIMFICIAFILIDLLSNGGFL